MGGKAQEPDLTFFFCFQEGFHSTSPAEDGIHILQPGHRMKLVEVKIIGPEGFQRLLKFLTGPCFLPLLRLAGQKDILAVGLKCGTEHLLGIPVSRGHVEIVHPVIDGLFHPAFSLGGGGIHYHDAPEADDGELFPCLPQGAFFKLTVLGLPDQRGKLCREHADQGDRHGGSPDKSSSFHLFKIL